MSSSLSPKRLVIATVPKSSIKNSSGVTTIRLPEGTSTRPSDKHRPLKVALPRNDAKPEKRIFIHVAPEIDIKKEEDDEVIFDDEVKSNGPVRKRQRLDHLSFEQKLLRRKLKNRVAAQSARDKKKAKMDELEIVVKSLERRQTHLADQNKLLHKSVAELQAENKELKEELKKRLTAPACVACSKRKVADDVNSTTTSPASPSISRDKVVSTPIRSAESINVPQQKEQAVRMALFLIMHGAMWAWTVTGILCLMPIAYHYSTNSKLNCSALTANSLPVKKKFPDKWWGHHQKAWNPVDGRLIHR